MPLLVEAANFSSVCAQNFGTWNPYKDSVLLRKLMKHQILLEGVVHTTGEVVLSVFCKLLPVHNFYSEQNLCTSDLFLSVLLACQYQHKVKEDHV